VRVSAVRALSLLALLLGLGLLTAGSGSAAGDARVLAISFDVEVNPVTQDFVSHELERAADGHYDAVVILLNTPGGLLSSMDKIVLDELDASVPVIAYVSPKGGFAGSAGVWIAQAADVLAMAPETNIGSSTPINGNGQNIGSDLRRKMINHEAANLQTIMENHHRNGEWGVKAVKVASNLTERQALDQHVIDLVAPDLEKLLRQVDGMKVSSPGRSFTLHTAGAHVDTVHMSFIQRLLNTLIDPNLIGLLFLLGIMGIGFEVFHPGVVLPGTIGAISLIAALFGMSVLPVDWAGVALILLGIGLFVLEAHVPAHGAIAASGIISLTVGMLMLFRHAPDPYHVDRAPVLTIAVLIAISWAFVINKAVQARHAPVGVGAHTVLGATGEVRASGLVFVRGELWQARSADGEPLTAGEAVEVEGVDGLTLTVRPPRDLEPSA
jgi:membrane-bound serine protease (ClpP class)